MSATTRKLSGKSRLSAFFINCFLLLMFTVFPLFYLHRYTTIRHDKYYLFLALAGLLTAAQLCVLIFSSDKRQLAQRALPLSSADVFFLALLIVFAISTLLSDYLRDSFTGEAGRNQGLLIYLACFVVYLIISRDFVKKEYVFFAFAVTCAAVYLLCALNSFGIDPLNIYENYSAEARSNMTSTIGNRNLMSCFCCLSVPLFFVFFVKGKTALRFFYLSVSVLGIAAMVFADSMSGYLGIVPTFAFLALFLFRQSESRASKRLFPILLVLCAAVVLIFAGLFVFFTFFDRNTKLTGFIKFFRFSEHWGTHRGYIWMRTFEVFGRYDYSKVLLGSGPDTFAYIFEPYFSEFKAMFGDPSNNAAHNEFLNYLMTAGVLGLSAYILFVGSVLRRAFKAAKTDPLALGCCLSVLCYLLQSSVNCASAITTPIFFILIAIAENCSRRELSASQ